LALPSAKSKQVREEAASARVFAQICQKENSIAAMSNENACSSPEGLGACSVLRPQSPRFLAQGFIQIKS